MKAPNFFIIGAPKSGTTALVTYLRDHESVFFSVPKEPFFWSTDYPQLRQKNQFETLDAYLTIFKKANDRHLAVGEGSTNYLNSEVAVGNILEFNPQARFIVMLRNPVDMAYAFHAELIYSFYEDVHDFEQAWRLQESRRNGRAVPERCRAPQSLQYGRVASYSRQLERLISLVPENRRKMILFEDFIGNTKQVYHEVLSFLGLPDDGRTEFPKVHQARTHRFAAIHRFLRFPPPMLATPILRARRYLRFSKSRLAVALRQQFKTQQSRPPMRPELRAELEDYFRDDVRRVSELIGRDLTHWVAPYLGTTNERKQRP